LIFLEIEKIKKINWYNLWIARQVKELYKQTYEHHFYELKKRLQLSLAFLLGAFIFSYLQKKRLGFILIKPLNHASQHLDLIYTALPESFLAYLKISLFTALILSIPFFSYQAYLFISPGLHNFEKKFFKIICLCIPILFWSACFFVYFCIIPIVCKFFLSFGIKEGFHVLFQGKIEEYFSFITNLMLIFGVVFQLPIALIVLFLLKIITLQGMIEKRRIFIVTTFVIGGILTPPDVITQIMMAMPMCLLYETAIIFCKKVKSKEQKTDI